jgi:16S rRNA (adenine1518-N6/adenine1519-N6)-dimethyltransferase
MPRGRRLGQHFLADPRLLERIADAVAAGPDDVIVEIGPGKGSLTLALLARGARVVAIEKDRALARDCGWRIADCGFAGRADVVVGDALKLDWHGLHPPSAIRHPRWKIAGNIPYYITTPLIDKALTPPLPERIVFLVQAEVAERLAAAPGSKQYGALSVGVQAVARVERVLPVAPGAFQPRPRVASALVRLTPLVPSLIAPHEGAAFRRFVTACFAQRRKQLRNAVAAALDITPAAAAGGLERLGLDPTARPERVAVADFVRLLRWGGRL